MQIFFSIKVLSLLNCSQGCAVVEWCAGPSIGRGFKSSPHVPLVSLADEHTGHTLSVGR